MDGHAPILFTKHQASGNDFLVLLDLEAGRAITASEACGLCDRHRGVGADGVIRVLAGSGADLAMELRNADGSEAEMSGNGIRCLVQAATDAGVVGEGLVTVSTLAGVRSVDYERTAPGVGYARVGMGAASVGAELSVGAPPGVIKALRIGMGNPHIVMLMDEVDDEVVREAGHAMSVSVDGGSNVEFVTRGPTSDGITLRVYERGVGETLACGTGACAAAVASKLWGLVDDEVDVDLPGGTLHVSITEGEVFLAGPTRKVCDVSVGESELAGMETGSTSAMVGRL